MNDFTTARENLREALAILERLQSSNRQKGENQKENK